MDKSGDIERKHLYIVDVINYIECLIWVSGFLHSVGRFRGDPGRGCAGEPGGQRARLGC